MGGGGGKGGGAGAFRPSDAQYEALTYNGEASLSSQKGVDAWALLGRRGEGACSASIGNGL